MTRTLRRFGYLARYLRELLRVALFTRGGIWSRTGRILLLGKLRRLVICLVPGLPAALRRRYELSGGCVRCGTSCNLLIQCPHWVETTGLCGIYEDRPEVCRQFPITPADMRDLELARSASLCGYRFGRPDA